MKKIYSLVLFGLLASVNTSSATDDDLTGSQPKMHKRRPSFCAAIVLKRLENPTTDSVEEDSSAAMVDSTTRQNISENLQSIKPEIGKRQPSHREISQDLDNSSEDLVAASSASVDTHSQTVESLKDLILKDEETDTSSELRTSTIDSLADFKWAINTAKELENDLPEILRNCQTLEEQKEILGKMRTFIAFLLVPKGIQEEDINKLFDSDDE
jgi:hypothetical protein